MAQVTIRINGRPYDINCEDGQESHVQRLASVLAGKVAELVKQVGQAGDARLLVMAGLLVADELADARLRENQLVKQAMELNRQLADQAKQLAELENSRQSVERSSLHQVEEASDRIDAIARRLAAS